MQQTYRTFLIGMRVIARDPIMLVLLSSPLLIGIAFRFLIPLLDHLAVENLNFSLNPWYPLVDALMIILVSQLLALSSAFLMLEECDEGIGNYYRITPVGRMKYLIARIGIPTATGFACSIIITLLFGLSNMAFPTVLACAFVGAFASLAVAMMIVSLAQNRVEGLALSKVAGITLLGLFIAWFVPDMGRWLSALLPTFWIGELVLGEPLIIVVISGTLVSSLWIAVFLRLFLRRIS